MRKIAFVLVVLSTLILVEVSSSQVSNAKIDPKSKSEKVDEDNDLKDYPDYYKKRVIAFRAMIRKQPTRDAKVSAAVNMVKGESPYKKDALNFLAEVKAKEAVAAIIRLGEDRDYRPETAYALGEIGSEKAIDFLIRLLYDENENVRGNASLALKKITGLDLGYNYSENDENLRARMAQSWDDWWARNKLTFKAKEMTEEEKKDADEKWQKYGRGYLQKILNE